MRGLIFAAVASLGLAAAGPASATLFSYSIDNPGGSASQGDITNFSTSYDDSNELLSMSFTVEDLTGNIGWVALSPGPNPKGERGEFALMYMDFAGGDLYVYGYNGVNGGTSWDDPGDYIATYIDVLTVDVMSNLTTVSFNDLDISTIQAHVPTPDDTPGDWTGMAYGEKLGIWFHVVNATTFATDGTEITALTKSGKDSWYDTKNRHTTISEPGTLALIGLGLIGLGAAARRRK